MTTTVDEIADGIYRLSTWVPDIAPPAGFTFNQFLIDADEPLLFHTGPRAMFPLIADAVARILPVERLRWITFGHVEADECGSMNNWLAAAPEAQVAHGVIGCLVSLNDMADRLPRPLADGEVLDLGGKSVRHLDTPHVPHGWDAGVLYEETTGTLLCGDLFTHLGDGPALTSDDIIERAMDAETIFRSTSLAPDTADVIRRLGDLSPNVLALMHGSSFNGDGSRALYDLAGAYESQFLLSDGGSLEAQVHWLRCTVWTSSAPERQHPTPSHLIRAHRRCNRFAPRVFKSGHPPQASDSDFRHRRGFHAHEVIVIEIRIPLRSLLQRPHGGVFTKVCSSCHAWAVKSVNAHPKQQHLRIENSNTCSLGKSASAAVADATFSQDFLVRDRLVASGRR